MRDISEHLRELDEHGYTTFENLLSVSDVNEARALLEQSYEEKGIPSVAGSHPQDHEPGTLRTHNLTARGPVFRRIIQTPEIIACMEYLLGNDCILSDMGARSPLPGMPAQGLHRDGGPWCPRPEVNPHAVMPLVAQAMIALSEFSVSTGATRFVEMSHLTGVDPINVRPEDESLFVCSPGTVLIYDGGIIHGGGENSSNEIRYSIQGFFCRSSRRPFCDHTRSIPPNIVASETALMRRLWGFESQVMWEGVPRQYNLVEVEGAKPIFDYMRTTERQAKL